MFGLNIIDIIAMEQFFFHERLYLLCDTWDIVVEIVMALETAGMYSYGSVTVSYCGGIFAYYVPHIQIRLHSL